MVEAFGSFVISEWGFSGVGTIKFELAEWLRANGLLLLGIVVSLDTAFLFGYLVLSDIPFLQFVDLVLVSSISSQAVLFMFFAIPALLFNVRLNLVEGMIPLGRLAELGRPYLVQVILLYLLSILVIFVGDLRPGLPYFLSALAVVFFLYHPTETRSIGSTNYHKYGRLLRNSPKRVWRLAIRPYFVAMLRNTAWLLGMIIFAWVGFLRFSFVSGNNVQLLEINGNTVETAVVGRNSVGLIVRSDEGEYAIFPLQSISSISLPKQ